MRILLTMVVTALASAAVAADAAPKDDGGDERGRERFYQRLAAEHPELKGVDAATDEGRAKFQAVMAADMKKRLTERQAANHARLKTTLGFSDDEFKAIEPLLTRVEIVRLQRAILDPAGGFPGGRMGNRGPFNPQALVGDVSAEPTAKALQEATKALKAVVDDRQSNETEVAAALQRLREARAAHAAVVTKAADDLRSVLSPRQEAVLADQGILE